MDKVKYLSEQNNRLKQEISDLKQMIQMNKIQIDVLSKNNQSDKKFVDVIFNYRQSLDNVQKKNQALSAQLQSIRTQKLVIEQLNSQLASQQKSIQQLQKNRVKQLQTNIHSLQSKASVLEKNQLNFDIVTGFVHKNRDVFLATDQAIQFKAKQASWAEQLALLKDQVTQHKHNQQNLLIANGILRNKVVSLQAKLAMPNKNLGQILDKSLKRLMLYFIQTQKKMLTGDDSDSQQDDMELIAPQLISLFPQKYKKNQNDPKIPALDLLKVRSQQVKGIQKIKQQLGRRNHLTKDQKIQRLQVQLQFTRRCFTKNMIQMKSEHERRKILQNICQELQQRNYFLIQSNKQITQKLQKLKKDLKSNKEGQSAKIELEQDFMLETSFIKKDSTHNQAYTREQEVNKYLQNVETPFQYKLHLQLLAKDLKRNKKLQNIENMKIYQNNQNISLKQSNMSKLKRSTSNPFLYFNQRRNQIMQIKGQKQMEGDQRERLQQTAFVQNKQINLRFNQDLDDLQI